MHPRRMAVTTTQRTSLWLREVGGAHCDACLAKELKLHSPQAANRVTNALSGRSNFFRERGICRSCGAQRRVIQAV